MTTFRISLSCWALVSAAAVVPAFGQGGKNVWTGVYSAAQATRGEATFKKYCSGCHGDNLEGNFGPALSGQSFFDDFREDTLDPLFTFMRTNMPAAGIVEGATPAMFPDATYLELLSYVLKQNGIPEGAADLTADAVAGIQFVGKDGPAELPNLAQVSVVGCLTPGRPNEWTLTNIGSLLRTRELSKNTPEELKASAARPTGSRTLRLANVEDNGFDPAPHKGEKVLTKGVLYTDPKNVRVNVSLVQSLSATCAP